ncbi:unnamed protein product [Rotaria sordida]|uniref:Protein kinase domain-containing protein n=1 Tax=Rotaria sordida TaxID=392033 RepID=A0A815XU69_9BILA|nr:unnamed protein product [Rotaria sordida]CAF1561782.1 unnamed protein product [Rotaria sordida]
MNKNHFELDLNQLRDPSRIFELIKVVENGRYEQVYKDRLTKTSQLVSIKVMDVTEGQGEEIKSDVNIFKKVGN